MVPTDTSSHTSLRSAQKLRDRIDHRLLLVFAQFGEDGQSQHFARGALRFREVAFLVAQALQRFLQMQRDGVIDLGPDLARW